MKKFTVLLVALVALAFAFTAEAGGVRVVRGNGFAHRPVVVRNFNFNRGFYGTGFSYGAFAAPVVAAPVYQAPLAVVDPYAGAALAAPVYSAPVFAAPAFVPSCAGFGVYRSFGVGHHHRGVRVLQFRR